MQKKQGQEVREPESMDVWGLRCLPGIPVRCQEGHWRSQSRRQDPAGLEIESGSWRGTVARTCNPSTLGGRGRQITSGQEFETSLATIVKPISTNYTKISGAWWRTPVISLLGRMRQENCLNPGGGGCGEPRSCHCTPAGVTAAKLRLKNK